MKKTIDETKACEEADRNKEKTTDSQIIALEYDVSSDKFSARLNEAKGNESARHLAGRTGLSETVLRAYIKGESEPTRPALVRMARALGVNIAWLATGEGTMKSGKQVTDERASYTAAARDSVDLERLEEVISKVEQYLQERGVTRPPEVKAQLIAWIYDIARRKELIEKNDLVGLLDLIY